MFHLNRSEGAWLRSCNSLISSQLANGCRFHAVDRDFTGASGSVGPHTGIGENAAFVVNFTGSSRAPALAELFNFGPHPGNLAFEIGNPDLKLERSVGVDLSVRGRGARGHGEVNFFVYDISNFVCLDITDEIEDGLRVANFVQGDSRFTGVDAAGHLHLGPRVELHTSLGYVRAQLTDTNESLPRIPPFHGRVELEAKLVPSPSVLRLCFRASKLPGDFLGTVAALLNTPPPKKGKKRKARTRVKKSGKRTG